MAHLVDKFLASNGNHKTLAACQAGVRNARDYHAAHGAGAICRASEAQGRPDWGSTTKRMRVSLPGGPRPELISSETRQHNLVEVINQCATMERLLDALAWAQAEPSLSGHLVERCHPTTSSSKEDGEDHDLVLISPDRTGAKAKFEVSDVASERDSNGKEKKDLESLGVPLKGRSQGDTSGVWPSGRLFLVVSEEFAVWLRRRRAKPVHYHYKEVKPAGTTSIFEVRQGTGQ